MYWGLLIFAGLLEMVGLLFINEWHLHRRYSSLVFFSLAFGTSFLLLRFIMTAIPMATTYAVWTGIGASGGALVGILFYRESKHPLRLACIGLILFGAIGLRLAS